MATDRGIPTRLSTAVRLLLVVNETSTPSYPTIPSERRPSGQQLQSQTVHGRRQATQSSSASNGAVQTGHGRSTGRQSGTFSSTSTSIVLVGAACGSGFVLVAVLIAVMTFVLRRRRLHQQLQPLTLVGIRSSFRRTCCCCSGSCGIGSYTIYFQAGTWKQFYRLAYITN